MLRRALFFFLFALTVYSVAAGQSAPIIVRPGNPEDPHIPRAEPVQEPGGPPQLKPADLDSRKNLEDATRMQLIRLTEAEFVHVRKNFPVGDKSMVIEPDGLVKPGDAQLYRMAQTYGAAAKIGDRVQITNITFREKSIYIEINGGPKKKTKWYNRIEISGMGGSTGGADPNQGQATGAAVTLEFKKHVPEMTGNELQQLLRPVLDFSVKTANEVFIDTLPPKIRAAVKNHEVLVGMNHDMVVMARDRPPQKVREKDEKGKEYEEWIYGTPPQDVVFVRFNGDEVVQVKIAKVGGQMTVKTQKEIEVRDGVPTLAALKASETPQDVTAPTPQQDQPKHKPTLKRPDEQPDPMVQKPSSSQSASDQDEPQWGTDGKQPPADGQPTDTKQKPADGQQKPPQP
jgi:hypothetical protein